MSVFGVAKSTGGFGKFGLPGILLWTAGPRVTTSTSRHTGEAIEHLIFSGFDILHFLLILVIVRGEPEMAGKGDGAAYEPIVSMIVGNRRATVVVAATGPIGGKGKQINESGEGNMTDTHKSST